MHLVFLKHLQVMERTTAASLSMGIISGQKSKQKTSSDTSQCCFFLLSFFSSRLAACFHVEQPVSFISLLLILSSLHRELHKGGTFKSMYESEMLTECSLKKP